MKPFIYLVIVLLFISCKNEDEYDYALVYTGEVTNISSDGATLSGKITGIDIDEITEYGFVWDTITTLSVDGSEKYTCTNIEDSQVFSKQITSSLNEDIEYYAKAYTKCNNSISYGNIVSFYSLGSNGPDIYDFSPKQVNLLDTVIIIGDNFSVQQDNNKVYVDDYEAEITKWTQDSLIIVVPDSLSSEYSYLSISIFNNKSTSEEKIQLLMPVVSDFSPKVGSISSEITINGSNLLEYESTLSIFIDDYQAEINKISDNQILVQVPDSLDDYSSAIKITTNNIELSTDDNFELEEVTFIDFSPKEGSSNEYITISGSNFNTNTTYLNVTVGNFDAEIISISDEEIVVSIPDSVSSRNLSVDVDMKFTSHSFSDNYVIGELQLDDFSPKTIESGSTITLTGEYFSAIKEYNSVTIDGYEATITSASSTQIEVTMPDKYNFYSSREVEISVKAFNDSASYDETLIINNNWFRLQDFPGANTTRSTYGHVIGDKVYMTKAVETTLWSYDIESQEWTTKTELPFDTYFYDQFTLNTNIYIITTDSEKTEVQLWQYDSTTDAWAQKANFPGDYRATVVSFSIGDKAYAGWGYYKDSSDDYTYYYDQWEYDETTDSWTEIESHYSLLDEDRDKITIKHVLVVGDIAYCIGTTNGTAAYGTRGYTFGFSPNSETTWTEYTMNADITSSSVKFDIDNIPYFKVPRNNYPYKFDISTDMWEQSSIDIDIDTSGEYNCFQNDDLIYFIDDNIRFWEYDPNR